MYAEENLVNSSAFWAIFSDTVQWMATSLIARDWYYKNQVALGAEPSADEIEQKRQELEFQFGQKIHHLYRSQAVRQKLIERE